MRGPWRLLMKRLEMAVLLPEGTWSFEVHLSGDEMFDSKTNSKTSFLSSKVFYLFYFSVKALQKKRVLFLEGLKKHRHLFRPSVSRQRSCHRRLPHIRTGMAFCVERGAW